METAVCRFLVLLLLVPLADPQLLALSGPVSKSKAISFLVKGEKKASKFDFTIVTFLNNLVICPKLNRTILATLYVIIFPLIMQKGRKVYLNPNKAKLVVRVCPRARSWIPGLFTDVFGGRCEGRILSYLITYMWRQASARQHVFKHHT